MQQAEVKQAQYLESFAETERAENQIPGVVFKELKTFADERGFFRELVRVNDPFFQRELGAQQSGSDQAGFAQWSHSKMAKNTVKAWHYHHRQLDWWYLPLGLAQVVLVDNRPESPTYRRKISFLLGESELDVRVLSAVVRIPQGVLHGCKVLSETAHLFYITSETYNPADEGRYRYNSPEVGFNWGPEEELITAPNDRVDFIPQFERAVLTRS